ncbi:nickel pincer cofactor biosynthesis protein LarC [Pseudoflavonifractor phocaeensis]|uniref:nickel pincer cofactor biosynthesis protein LarC n=1 Tax=Pseudoflavonifractor phocaeensis TaxID=1870988 RepID=UPI00195B7DFE|nr:nickel pincer cofactor biosynthesis protein LarC [Pseudoflavonifractor phocaeensis]
MKTLYIECHMGAAGDMLMSALYELLEDKEGFLKTMNGLGLPGVHVEAAPGVSGGIAGTHMKVTVHGQEELEHDHDHHEHEHDHNHHEHEHDHHHDHDHDHPHAHEHEHHHHHATPGHIAEIIDALALPEEVKANARAVYDAIARAEAKAHGCPVGDVHYHEVGALDAVADVTGVCYAIYLLQPDRVVVSPVHVGSGTVKCAHGIMPVPAPATANLLAGVPVYGGEVMGELCTPTGAALLTHFAQSFGPMPPMSGSAVGCGVGTKVFAGRANCVRVFLGEDAQSANGSITELVCNIDDMTPEALAFAADRLLELGALDVYTVPGTMKKGRPGHVLTVLCEEDQEAELARAVLEQTTTIGLRVRRCGKYFLTPGSRTVETPWGPVQVKTAQGFGVSKAAPEYESAAALARANGLPIQTVLQEAAKGL